MTEMQNVPSKTDSNDSNSHKPSLPYLPVTHCIFDLDGLLVDSESIYFTCFDMVLKEFGHSYSHEAAAQLRGTTRIESGRWIVRHYELPISVDEFLARLDKLLKDYMVGCKLMPGVERLIRHLHRHRVPIAIATGSTLKAVQTKTSAHREFFELFSHVVSASDDEDVKAGKPAPDVFVVCAKKFVPPLESVADRRRALVFEDAINGVRAALAADMQVVLVPDPRAVTEQQQAEATMCLKSLELFKPELFGLPSFETCD